MAIRSRTTVMFVCLILLATNASAFAAVESDQCGTDRPVAGTICADGSIFVGFSTEDERPVFTTPTDAGQFPWNDGNIDGFAGTAPLGESRGIPHAVALAEADSNTDRGGSQPHRAARHCVGLDAHGHRDWYLPTAADLNLLFANKAAIGRFNITVAMFPGWYWSSTEKDAASAEAVRFSDGMSRNVVKYYELSVRCVRKGS